MSGLLANDKSWMGINSSFSQNGLVALRLLIVVFAFAGIGKGTSERNERVSFLIRFNE